MPSSWTSFRALGVSFRDFMSTGAAGAEGAAAGALPPACPCPAEARAASGSSPGAPVTAMGVNTSAKAPSSRMIFRRVPSSVASTGMVVLSVLISKSTSPFFTFSPTCLCHLTSWPSSMLKPSLGMMTTSAIAMPPYTISRILAAIFFSSGISGNSSAGLKGRGTSAVPIRWMGASRS